MKLSDYVIDFFAKQGVTNSFVVSGGAVIHLINSCSEHPDMDYICSQHEQNGGASADMYARLSGKLGLVMTTSGPGATNLLTSVCNAYFDSVPLICLTGQVARFRLRKTDKLRQRGFQETDIVAIFKSVTKYTTLIIDPLMIRYELEKSVYYALEGRPGPVVLDIPDDLQREEIDPLKLKPFIPPKKKKILIDNEVNSLLKMLSESLYPIIIIGAGVHIGKAEKECVKFLNDLNIPVLLTWGARDLLPYDHPLNMGPLGVCGPRGGNFAVQKSDLVIAIGTRLSQMITGGKQNLFSPNSKKVMIDIDCEELKKFDKSTFVIDLPICSDLKPFFSKFGEKNYRISSSTFKEWIRTISEWKRTYPVISTNYKLFNKRINPYVFIQELSNQCKEGQIIIGDTGANLCWTMQTFQFKPGQRMFSAWNHTPMGFSLPASIGAFFATKKEIICLIGDGGLMMCLSELGTVRRNNLPIKIFVFDNQSHGIQKQTMDTWLQSRYSAANVETGLFFPDYEHVSKAFSLPNFCIKEHSSMSDIIEKVLSLPGPVFCNVEIFEDQKITPMLKFGAGLQDLDPKLPVDELEKIMNPDELLRSTK